MVLDYKIVVYGSFAVGKTSLLHRLLRQEFLEMGSSTIGAAFAAWKPMIIDPVSQAQKQITIGIWDTAGQERFASLLPIYLRSADAIVFCWDSTQPFSESLVEQYYKIAQEHSPKCYFYLVLTKMDAKVVPHIAEAAEEFAATHNTREQPHIFVFSTSAKSGQGVKELFDNIAVTLSRRDKVPKTSLPLRTDGKPRGSCSC
jgi:Ras-related protein Rab-5C